MTDSISGPPKIDLLARRFIRAQRKELNRENIIQDVLKNQEGIDWGSQRIDQAAEEQQAFTSLVDKNKSSLLELTDGLMSILETDIQDCAIFMQRIGIYELSADVDNLISIIKKRMQNQENIDLAVLIEEFVNQHGSHYDTGQIYAILSVLHDRLKRLNKRFASDMEELLDKYAKSNFKYLTNYLVQEDEQVKDGADKVNANAATLMRSGKFKLESVKNIIQFVSTKFEGKKEKLLSILLRIKAIQIERTVHKSYQHHVYSNIFNEIKAIRCTVMSYNEAEKLANIVESNLDAKLLGTDKFLLDLFTFFDSKFLNDFGLNNLLHTHFKSKEYPQLFNPVTNFIHKMPLLPLFGHKRVNEIYNFFNDINKRNVKGATIAPREQLSDLSQTLLEQKLLWLYIVMLNDLSKPGSLKRHYKFTTSRTAVAPITKIIADYIENDRGADINNYNFPISLVRESLIQQIINAENFDANLLLLKNKLHNTLEDFITQMNDVSIVYSGYMIKPYLYINMMCISAQQELSIIRLNSKQVFLLPSSLMRNLKFYVRLFDDSGFSPESIKNPFLSIIQLVDNELSNNEYALNPNHHFIYQTLCAVLSTPTDGKPAATNLDNYIIRSETLSMLLDDIASHNLTIQHDQILHVFHIAKNAYEIVKKLYQLSKIERFSYLSGFDMVDALPAIGAMPSTPEPPPHGVLDRMH